MGYRAIYQLAQGAGSKPAGRRPWGPLNRRQRHQHPDRRQPKSSNRDIRRHRAPEAGHRTDELATTTSLRVLAGMAGDGVVGLNCRPLGRIQIGAACNRGSGTAKVFFVS